MVGDGNGPDRIPGSWAVFCMTQPPWPQREGETRSTSRAGGSGGFYFPYHQETIAPEKNHPAYRISEKGGLFFFCDIQNPMFLRSVGFRRTNKTVMKQMRTQMVLPDHRIRGEI